MNDKDDDITTAVRTSQQEQFRNQPATNDEDDAITMTTPTHSQGRRHHDDANAITRTTQSQ